QVMVQLSATLAGVVYQRLLPRIGGGLIAAYEVMVANHAVRNLVREGKTRPLRNVVSTHQAEGMQTIEMARNDLVAAGAIEYETALTITLCPTVLDTPAPPALSVIAVHIPVGLLDQPRRGGRTCDKEARRVLGWPRAGAIQSAPARKAVGARTYDEAVRRNDGMSVVTWFQLPKIAEVAAE